MTDVTPPDGAPDTPESFADFARRIGKSRPYVSQKVADGTICPPALTADRKIIPSLALQQLAAAATRPKAAAPAGTPDTAAAGTLNAERIRLTTAQADRTELENLTRRGELIPRTALAAVLPTIARAYVDQLGHAIRDLVADPALRARLLDRVAAETEKFIAEALKNGGAPPAP